MGEPAVAVVYIHVPGNVEFTELTRRFVHSYRTNQPGSKHRVIVVSKGEPVLEMKQLLLTLPNVSFFAHDGSGWDIGGYIAVSRTIPDDLMVCFGGTSFLQHPNWLRRMVEVWDKHGPGFYGSLATFEISPHINTSGFWCSPRLLAQYPIKVETKAHRYDFEHGPNAMWKVAAAKGEKVLLVTWDGEYEWPEWRTPPNIYRRGDQSNCITFFRHSSNYGSAKGNVRIAMEKCADTLTDPKYLELKKTYDSERRLQRLSVHNPVRVVA